MWKEVLEEIKELGYPVEKELFNPTNKTRIPEPPYITYMETETVRVNEPKIKQIVQVDIEIELYTDRTRNEKIEREIEDILTKHDITHTKAQAKIPSENMVETLWETTITEKRKRGL